MAEGGCKLWGRGARSWALCSGKPMQNDRDRDSGVGIRIIWLMWNAAVFLSVFSFCDFFSSSKYPISLPLVCLIPTWVLQSPASPYPTYNHLFPDPKRGFFGSQAKVYTKAEILQSVGGGVRGGVMPFQGTRSFACELGFSGSLAVSLKPTAPRCSQIGQTEFYGDC